MSLFKKLGKIVKKAAPQIGAIGGMYLGGPSGAAFGSQLGASLNAPSMPGAGFVPYSGSMASLPPLIRAGQIAGAAGGYMVRGARAIAASASYYCRKYPAWCSTIGGLAAVEAMVGSGQLPPIKRRRRKGITPRDLSSFRRVASLIKSYGPTARKVPSSCAPRKTCKR